MKNLFWSLAVCAGLMNCPAMAERIAVAAWNIEDFEFNNDKRDAGIDQAQVAVQLRDDFNQVGIFAFSEVYKQTTLEVFSIVANSEGKENFRYVYGETGRSVRLGVMFDTNRYEFLGSEELDFGLHPLGTRFPLAVTLKSKESGLEFIVVANHFSRSNDKPDRLIQAKELSAWAAKQDLPIIAAGDFNFDYDFVKGRGNREFAAFMKAGVFRWQTPERKIDTNWANDNGQDKYPNSYLDFVFAAGDAANWRAKSYVYRRFGDFPHTSQSSDHRPVVTIFETDSRIPLEFEVTDYMPKMFHPPVNTGNYMLSAGVPKLVRESRSEIDVDNKSIKSMAGALTLSGTSGSAGGPKVMTLSHGGEIPWPLYFAVADQSRGEVTSKSTTFIGNPAILLQSKEVEQLVERIATTPSFSKTSSIVGYVTPDTDLNDFPPHLWPLIRSLKEMGGRLPSRVLER